MLQLLLILLPLIFSAELCETYSKLSSQVCVNCKPSYQRDRVNLCIYSLPSFIPNLIENCAVYSSSLTCASCNNGYSLEENRCHPICLPGCSCFEPFECLESSIRQLIGDCNSKCQSCCFDGILCCTCNPGYTLEFGVCIDSSDCLIPNCQTCCSGFMSCCACQTGFSLSLGLCISISSCQALNCQTCDSSGQLCVQCNSGFVLVEGICLACLSQNCAICSDIITCIGCSSGYTLQAGQCIIGSSSCSVAYCQSCSSEKYCQNCMSGYNAVNGTCEANCYDPYCTQCVSSGQYGCILCSSGYFLELGGTCQPCPSHCLGCISEICDSCENGYSLSSAGTCTVNSSSDLDLIGLAIGLPIGISVLVIAIIFIVCYCRHKKRSTQEPCEKKVDEVVELAENEKNKTNEPQQPYYPYADPGYPTAYPPVLEIKNPSMAPYCSSDNYHEILQHPPFDNPNSIPVENNKNLSEGADIKAAGINSNLSKIP